jgi:hypothetical protein
MLFFTKLILCLLPILMTPIWGHLLSYGYLDFGGGDKDIFLLIPWLFWSFFYLLIFIVAWIMRKKIKVILFYAIGGATGIFALTWIVLFIWSNDILGVYQGK